ncbi:MAG TPA: urease subunit beta [Actinomycetota bacterium]|nr:urease subunit beta [Actinomycetota bacterium]
MHLSPTEEDRLRVFTAAELARRTLARGLKLNAPEATALICDEMHAAARAGASFGEVLEAGRGALRVDQVMDGVPELVDEVRVEVLLDEGSRLVVLRPWGERLSGDQGIGALGHPKGDIPLAEGRRRIRLAVTNTSTRPVRVSSHYPFWRVNHRLAFDRTAARGFRLDIPAGTSVRWDPGESREVELVAYGGPLGGAGPT